MPTTLRTTTTRQKLHCAPTTRGLTLIVDGDTIAVALSMSAQYPEHNALNPDQQVRRDPRPLYKGFLSMAKAFAGTHDDKTDPPVSAYLVRSETPRGEYGTIDHPLTDEDLAALGFQICVVPRARRVGESYRDYRHRAPGPSYLPQTIPEGILLLVAAQAGSDDLLIVSQNDPDGWLSAKLLERQTLSDGTRRRITAACFTRLEEGFGLGPRRGSDRELVHWGAASPKGRLPLELRDHEFARERQPDGTRFWGYDFRHREPYFPFEGLASEASERIDLITDGGFQFLYTEDIPFIVDEDDEWGYPHPDYSQIENLQEARLRSCAPFVARIKSRATGAGGSGDKSATPAERATRPVVALIDHPSIDWANGEIVGRENLGRGTRPDWSIVRSFLEERSGAEKLAVRSFLKIGVPRDFVTELEELGFAPLRLTPPEDGAEQAGGLTASAIAKALDEIRGRDVDIVLVSNNPWLISQFQQLRDFAESGAPGSERRLTLVWLDIGKGTGPLGPGIEALDLEHDVGAFNAKLPNRWLPGRIDDFNAADTLGDFGLKPIAGDRLAVAPDAAELESEADDE